MADRVKKLADKNRRASEVDVRAALAALRRLRESGIEPRRFGLLPPFGGERPRRKVGRSQGPRRPQVNQRSTVET
jgi:hypothetical protein